MSGPSLTLLADRRAREGSPGGEPRLEARGPMPKRRASRTVAPAPKPLSGLTADELRVHHILLGALARVNGDGHLTYVERKHLAETLDLAFLDDQIRTMERRRTVMADVARLGLVMGVVGGPLAIGFALGNGAPVVPFVIAFAAMMVACIAALVRSGSSAGTTERQQVYEALRELALVLDGGDAPVSEALLRADALIDTLASGEAPRGVARVRS